MTDITIRPLIKNDLSAVKDIYNHYIKNTHINFETNPYNDEYMQNWFAQFDHSGRYHAYIAAQEGQILGFAFSQKYRPKPAYSTSVETTIYLTQQSAGKGLGKRLGQHLLDALKQQDLHRAYAGVALPNDASIGFHKKLGYKVVGNFNQVGRKFDKYYDMVLLEYRL